MADRKNFLEGIRAALGAPGVQERRAEQFPAVFSRPDVSSKLAVIAHRSADDHLALLTRFREQAEAIRVQVHLAPDYAAATEIIGGIARQSEPEFGPDKQIIQHDTPELHALNLAERFAGENIAVHTATAYGTEVRNQTIASYIGITAADWGLAESGTVVQLTRPGNSRSTSLVPSIHIALLPVERILADLSELQALLQDQPPESSFVLISGPSKTADIESHLVYGAHGPRDMHVVVLTGR